MTTTTRPERIALFEFDGETVWGAPLKASLGNAHEMRLREHTEYIRTDAVEVMLVEARAKERERCAAVCGDESLRCHDVNQRAGAHACVKRICALTDEVTS